MSPTYFVYGTCLSSLANSSYLSINAQWCLLDTHCSWILTPLAGCYQERDQTSLSNFLYIYVHFVVYHLSVSHLYDAQKGVGSLSRK